MSMVIFQFGNCKHLAEANHGDSTRKLGKHDDPFLGSS